ncbi:MAG: phosphoribosylformylglycinamidine synthase [Bacteroides sp.]|nr:hypothetical protein [Roseburia sp.]MCM1347401.1 phosphoribosylformylglycinamidine synthase [Bacteroides sp.]MCM1421886.1 phosphoribosylformylglycinamidine synthase [Bacteroides sp.]
MDLKIEKQDKQIRIYQSTWKNVLLFMFCALFVICGIFIISDEDCNVVTKMLGGWGSVLFFGAGGLFVLLVSIYNRIHYIPFLVIHEDRMEQYVQLKGSYHTIYFRDIERFRLIKVASITYIAIDYKPVPVLRKFNAQKPFYLTKASMVYKFKQTGAIDTFAVFNLTMNGKDICDVLNERTCRLQPSNNLERTI